MSPLRGLRTNCLLAPLTAAAIGALAILLAWRWHAGSLAEAEAAARLAEATALAHEAEAGIAPASAAWLAVHPEAVAAGRWRLAGETLEAVDAAGPALPHEATPDLVLAFQAARAWREGDRLGSAAPCMIPGAPQVVAVWWRPAPPPPARSWLLLAGGALLAGGGLGAYLVARVYRPVLWLERAAAAAASGAPEPPGRVDSIETESLRSSLATILGGRGDGHG